MTILVGLTPGETGTEALDLGATLARSLDEPIVVAVVTPTPWPPNPYRPDTEYLALQQSAGRLAIEAARSRLDGLRVDYLVQEARSVSSGLIDVAERTGANWLVLGSASSGMLGHVTLSGIAERVMHSTAIPVAIAPRGYAGPPGGRVARVSVGFGRADRDSDLLTTAVGVSVRVGAGLRVACFAVRPVVQTGSVEEDAEQLVVGAWTSHLEADIRRALESVEGTVAVKAETVVGQGGSWREALDDVEWAPGDLLVIGASSTPLSRFFLGSHGAKLVRNSSVAVVLVPRLLLAG